MCAPRERDTPQSAGQCGAFFKRSMVHGALLLRALVLLAVASVTAQRLEAGAHGHDFVAGVPGYSKLPPVPTMEAHVCEDNSVSYPFLCSACTPGTAHASCA